MRTRRKGRWLPKQPHLGARMCQGTFFSYRKLRFYMIKMLREDAHCGGMVECRLRDPPQAENPVEQDSFLSNLMFHHFPVILSALKRFCISVFLTRLVRGILCGCFCDSGEGLGSAGCNLWIGETDCRIIELFERPLFGKCGAYGLPAG